MAGRYIQEVCETHTTIALKGWCPIFGIGYMELTVIACVGLLLFGGRLPEMMKSLGASIPAFSKGMAEGKKEIHDIEATLKEEVKDAIS